RRRHTRFSRDWSSDVCSSDLAIVIGFAISLPLGWVAWRYRLLRGWVIVATGLLYTIPSLALLIIMPAVLGYSAISEFNLVVALKIGRASCRERGCSSRCVAPA